MASETTAGTDVPGGLRIVPSDSLALEAQFHKFPGRFSVMCKSLSALIPQAQVLCNLQEEWRPLALHVKIRCNKHTCNFY